jgi:hypothetical protein
VEAFISSVFSLSAEMSLSFDLPQVGGLYHRNERRTT